MKARAQVFFRSSDAVPLLTGLVVSLPLLFRNAVIHVFPMGYAGLFTQMAAQIADANFALPVSSPFYGPGGIPFAYPPLGLYLLALFIKFTGSTYFFLRWLPPLLSLLSAALTFFLSKKFFNLPFAAMITMILTAASFDLHTAHVWSAGIVRAPAFVFAILFIYFYSPGAAGRSLKSSTIAGVFLGLAFLSHLAYGLFCLFWLATASASLPDWKPSIRAAFVTGVIAVLVSSVWIIPVVSTHGWVVFSGALNSHGGSQFLSGSFRWSGLLRLLYFNLAPILASPALAFLVLVGLIQLLLRRQFRFVFFFVLITLFFPENARFVSWLGCFIAGYGLWFVSIQLSEWMGRFVRIPHYVWIFLALCVLWWNGFAALVRFSPLLTESALDLQERRAEVFLGDGTYLALLAQDEAEWLPFLLEREPLVSQWGSEWLGTYDEQTRLMSLFQSCRKEKDWDCVKAVFADMDDAPHFVITYRAEKKLNGQISADPDWVEVHANGRYTVWAESEPR